jgi:mannan endo-1,4-beta-mannosidase
VIAAIGIAASIAATFAAYTPGRPTQRGHTAPQQGVNPLPTVPGSYIGLYANGSPASYAGVKAFTMATGVTPGVVVYYSGWLEPFEVRFATTAAHDGAIPLVQLDPTNISIAAIAGGQYDSYLSAYAKAVRTYNHPVILSFGHEMNGYWYSWGYTHTSPVVFVAAWRHIVTLFRKFKASNVTWLWTINTIQKQTRVPAPGPWWPGDSFVTWIGIDGYFISSPSTFSSVFGPTIVYVRALTHHPIFIAETSAAQNADQPAKVAQLFSGIRLYGLLGFAWFDSDTKSDWRLRSPAAIAAFRRDAGAYPRFKS